MKIRLSLKSFKTRECQEQQPVAGNIANNQQKQHNDGPQPSSVSVLWEILLLLGRTHELLGGGSTGEICGERDQICQRKTNVFCHRGSEILFIFLRIKILKAFNNSVHILL